MPNKKGVRFFDLNTLKIVKDIEDAMAIVSYQPETPESNLGALTYLGRNKKPDKRLSLPEYFVNLPLDDNQN